MCRAGEWEDRRPGVIASQPLLPVSPEGQQAGRVGPMSPEGQQAGKGWHKSPWESLRQTTIGQETARHSPEPPADRTKRTGPDHKYLGSSVVV